MPTIDKALTSWAISKGVSPAAIDRDATAGDLIALIAGADAFASSNVTVAGATPSTKEYWGTKVSEMQTSIAVANGAITGTLKKLTSGSLVETWGEGYFIALKFTKNNAAINSIKVGLKPSISSGLVELDEDMDGVFKVTDKDAQLFEVLVTDGNVSYPMFYDLSGLTLSDS